MYLIICCGTVLILIVGLAIYQEWVTEAEVCFAALALSLVLSVIDSLL